MALSLSRRSLAGTLGGLRGLRQMDSQDKAEAIKEWETLRQETLQSQNQRFTAFQVSIALFAAVYGAYLSPVTNLRREPLIFQAFLLFLLLPFVALIRSLRLRDYYQACYISDFVRPRLPTVRYTLRNEAMGRVLRDRTSSTEAIKKTYLFIGTVTTVITIGLAILSPVDGNRCVAQRLGATDFGWTFWFRLSLLVGAVLSYIYVVAQKARDERWKEKVFSRFRQIAVQELLTNQLRAEAVQGRLLTDAEAWNSLYGNEREHNKRVTLSALAEQSVRYPELKGTIMQLRNIWKMPSADAA